MTTILQLTTAEDLWRMPADNLRHELVKGELRTMTPAGFEHGAVTMSLGQRLALHVRNNRLGVVLGAETGFILSRRPDTVRAADVAFVKQERLAGAALPKSYWPGAPDLAVEVVSPSDSLTEVEEKVDDYLKAGTALVWVVNPNLRRITVYRPGTNPVILREGDALDGAEVVPGFRCQVADAFAF